MNKYFTKEYIKECDCEEVQGLRKNKESKIELKYGDWFFNKITDKPSILYLGIGIMLNFIWLPTGDQLDKEIVKICKGTNGYYEFSYTDRTTPNKYFKSYTAVVDIPSKHISIEVKEDNPLIAKIKLLKELIK